MNADHRIPAGAERLPSCPADPAFAVAEQRPTAEFSPEQKAALRAALRLCRPRLRLPARGVLDYGELARQIAALPEAAEIRELVRWVRDYERADEISRGRDIQSGRGESTGLTSTTGD